MKQIEFFFDPISPYAYLAFEHLPITLQGLSYQVQYRPVLFAGLLKHHGQLGPAEIAGKREWTFRQVQWLAKAHGIELTLPQAHPFNPLGLLRLALACGASGTCNRYVTETIFHHVWRKGGDPSDRAALAQLSTTLAPQRSPDAEAVKAELRANTDAAIARSIFGVPTFALDDKLFWGFDALPMLREYLSGDAWYAGDAWAAAAALPVGE